MKIFFHTFPAFSKISASSSVFRIMLKLQFGYNKLLLIKTQLNERMLLKGNKFIYSYCIYSRDAMYIYKILL